MRRQAQVSPCDAASTGVNTAASRRIVSSDLTTPGRASRAPAIESRRVSASSWQRLLVASGGAPVPPECELAKPARRRRIPLRHSERLRTAPLVERDDQGI